MPPSKDDKKRKAEEEAKGAPKPKKMTKEERAAMRERARVAMENDSSNPKKKTPAKFIQHYKIRVKQIPGVDLEIENDRIENQSFIWLKLILSIFTGQ